MGGAAVGRRGAAPGLAGGGGSWVEGAALGWSSFDTASNATTYRVDAAFAAAVTERECTTEAPCSCSTMEVFAPIRSIRPAALHRSLSSFDDITDPRRSTCSVTDGRGNDDHERSIREVCSPPLYCA